MKKTKIVCTIGPASENKIVLEKMARAGMNVARLNFSHGTYDNHRLLIKNIRDMAKKVGTPIAIMQDLQGPRIRVGDVHKDGIDILRGEKVVLVPEKLINYKLLVTGDDKIIPIGYQDLHKYVKVGGHVLISDGLIDIKVNKVKDGFIHGKVIKPGIILSHKGINLPGTLIEAEVITAKDKKDLIFGLSQGIDFVALSFVKDAANVIALRKLLGNKDVQIISKIERKEALNNFDEILEVTDGVMVARGDLGIEIPPADVPLAQKDMIQRCMLVGKPVIVATQMLESMMLNPRPTRAEVSDVANAVIDHTDAVMLSGESAYGKYPVESVQMMADVIKKTEASRFDDLPGHYLKITHPNIQDSISIVAYDLALQEDVKAIVVNSLSGRAARMVVRHRPETTIAVLTNNQRTQNKLALSWGIQALLLPKCKTLDELIRKSVTLMKNSKLVKAGDNIVLVSGHPVGTSEGVNMVKLHSI
ncbi:MAG: pyruvate kinase [bacterium]|nr:pyruvate kinase [bacterium]